MTAAALWAQALAEWALPEEVVATAPECPYGFAPEVFVDVARAALDGPPTPTHRRVVEVLPLGGALLDVGCGGGAASLPVAPPARRIVAVDQDPRMLDALVDLAGGRAEVDPVEGRWPDVADRVGTVDVAVCAHVAYNVPDLAAFVEALTRLARRRVVLELSAVHPQSSVTPLWRRFWGLDRPTGPTAEDAQAVIREATGAETSAERWTRTRSFMGDRNADTVAWMRRRLCLPASADPQVAEAMRDLPELAPSAIVTLWWPGRA